MADTGPIECRLFRSAEGWVLQSESTPFRLGPEMVVGRGFGPYITVFSHEEFERLSDAIDSSGGFFGKNARSLRRYLHGASFDIKLDSAGSLLIPNPLIEAAGLDQGSNQPLTVIAFPEHFHWEPSGHWALWAKERRWEALELMRDRSQRDSEEVVVAVHGLYLELVKELRRDPVGFYRLKPRVFEELCAELMAHRGFEVELTPETRDGGVDLYAVQHTAFGRLLLAVDCKRYLPNKPVSVGVVRGMLGAIDIAPRASAGLLITTSRFSAPAETLAEEHPFRIGLQDYFDLQLLLAEYAESDGNSLG